MSYDTPTQIFLITNLVKILGLRTIDPILFLDQIDIKSFLATNYWDCQDVMGQKLSGEESPMLYRFIQSPLLIMVMKVFKLDFPMCMKQKHKWPIYYSQSLSKFWLELSKGWQENCQMIQEKNSHMSKKSH